MATTQAPQTPRQQSIPGTEPDNQHVAAAIEIALDAKDEQKRAAERKKAADDAVLILMVASGLTHYPYTDRDTGKRKWWIVDTTPRGRSVNQRSELPSDQEADEPEMSESERVERAAARAERDANEVTHRRVPRATAEAEIAAIADETRARDNADNQMAQADAAVDGALRPARTYDDDDTGEIPDAADADEAEPVLPREPERFELLELHDKPSPAVNHAVEVAADETEDADPEPGATDKRFDPELLAAGKCGLRSKSSAGNFGAGCELAPDHKGLHVSDVHRWKARRPKVDAEDEQVATP